MKIYDVTEERFCKYGKVIKNIDFSALVEAMRETPVPEDVVYRGIYEASGGRRN